MWCGHFLDTGVEVGLAGVELALLGRMNCRDRAEQHPDRFAIGVKATLIIN